MSANLFRRAYCTLPALLAVSTPALATNPTSWICDFATTGQDVIWNAPDLLDIDADFYDAHATITRVEVDVRLLLLNLTLDITDRFDPDSLNVSARLFGPDPESFALTQFAYPAPPLTVGLGGLLKLGIGPGGAAQLQLTNVLLGATQLEIPGLGLRLGTIIGARFLGHVSVTAQTFLKGDTNCDGAITVSDIGPFVQAVTNAAQYQANFPDCDLMSADMNEDEHVTVGDIGLFVAAVTGA